MNQDIFTKPKVSLKPNDIIACFTVRDDIERLPWFLEYYRNMGVAKFFAVDNDSKDGTSELLKSQEDVVYFHTDNSYVSSKAGRLWTTELCNFYGQNRWCLTLDVDELLVFPGCEYISLVNLCSFMDRHQFQGLFTVFLDMYSDKTLSQTEYTSGQPFLEVCNYFDNHDTYQLKSPRYFPSIQVFGGPRQRMFWDNGNHGNGPSMRKIPLVKWNQDFQYNHSTHSTSPIRLANFTGALLHFKFFASFKNLAIKEVERGDRMQMKDYQKYSDLVQQQDLDFKHEDSIKYENSLTLVEHGVITTTKRLTYFIGSKIRAKHGEDQQKYLNEAMFSAQKTAEKTALLSLKHLPQIWQIIQHSLSATNFTNTPTLENSPKTSFNPYLRYGVVGDILYVNDKYIGGWVYNPTNLAEKLEIVILNNQEYLTQTIANKPALSRFNSELPPGNCYFQIPTPEKLLHNSHNSVDLKVVPSNVYLNDQPIQFNGLTKIRRSNFDGVCERVRNNSVRGWVWDQQEPEEFIEIAIYIDEQLLFTVTANQARQDLKGLGKGHSKHGFSFKLPKNLQDDQIHTLSIRIVNTALHLRKTPIAILNGNTAS